MVSARRAAPKRRSFTQGFAFGSATFAANALISLVSAIATARLYGVDVIGQYALAYAPTGAVWYLSTVQEQPALVRKLAALEPREPRVSGLWYAVLAFSEGLTVLVALIGGVVTVVVFRGPLHHPGLVAPALTMLAGLALLGNPGWNVDTLLASFRAGRELFAVRFHQIVMFLVAAVALSFVTSSVWGMVAALCLSYSSSLLHRLVVSRHFLTVRVDRAQLRAGFGELPEILRFGLKVMPGAVAGGASSEAGTWILGGLTPVSAVGAWNRAGNISKRLNDISSRVADMLLPTLVERQAKGDLPGFHRAVVDSMRYVAAILLFPAAIAGGAAAGVITLLFGPGFGSANGALPLLLLVPVILSINVFGSRALMAFNRPLTTTALEGGRMVITVAAGVGLTLAFGATGMGAAMVIGCVAELAVLLSILTGQLDSPLYRLWPPQAMLAQGLAYGAGFAAARVVSSAIGGPGGTLLALMAGAASYAAWLLTFGGVLSRDRKRFGAALATRRGALARRRTPISLSVPRSEVKE